MTQKTHSLLDIDKYKPLEEKKEREKQIRQENTQTKYAKKIHK